MKKYSIEKIASLLTTVAQARELTDEHAWDYGWFDEGYRHSQKAAIQHDESHAVRLHPQVLAAFEGAVNDLCRVPAIRDLYDREEFWGVVASLVGTLPLDGPIEDLREQLRKELENLVTPSPTLVLLPIANLAPLRNRLQVGPISIGTLDAEYYRWIESKTGCKLHRDSKEEPWWLTPDSPTEDAPMIFSFETKAQLGRAEDEAKRAFEDLIALVLMFQPDLDALELYSLRGPANQPGIRGLVLDRVSLTAIAKRAAEASRELYASVLLISDYQQSKSIHWYSTDPFPLEKLLEPQDVRSDLQEVLLGSNSVARRLRTAARWHAKAHWSLDRSDAVLALGISFDSMLTERSATPGRILAERFALLDPRSQNRRERYRLFHSEYYPIRSAVAHGGDFDADFPVREMAREARWVFRQIFNYTRMPKAESESDYQAMFDNLKWC